MEVFLFSSILFDFLLENRNYNKINCKFYL